VPFPPIHLFLFSTTSYNRCLHISSMWCLLYSPLGDPLLLKLVIKACMTIHKKFLDLPSHSVTMTSILPDKKSMCAVCELTSPCGPLFSYPTFGRVLMSSYSCREFLSAPRQAPCSFYGPKRDLLPQNLPFLALLLTIPKPPLALSVATIFPFHGPFPWGRLSADLTHFPSRPVFFRFTRDAFGRGVWDLILSI